MKLHNCFDNIIPLIKKINFKVAITEKYSRIPCELVADPLGTGRGSLGTRGPHFGKYLLNTYSLKMTQRVLNILELKLWSFNCKIIYCNTGQYVGVVLCYRQNIGEYHALGLELCPASFTACLKGLIFFYQSHLPHTKTINAINNNWRTQNTI